MNEQTIVVCINMYQFIRRELENLGEGQSQVVHFVQIGAVAGGAYTKLLIVLSHSSSHKKRLQFNSQIIIIHTAPVLIITKFPGLPADIHF